MNAHLHRTSLPGHLKIAILSISAARTFDNDKNGLWIKKQGKKEGHEVVLHQLIPNDAHAITEALEHIIERISPHAVIIIGGTGISPRDVTLETVQPLFDKELTSFGPIFAQLNFEQIDSAAILSRATAGFIKGTVIFCIPDTLNACKLACSNLIFPELGHLIKHAKE
ncbi:molybdopterin-binding protein [uncultured Desulfobacter sp.]|uniref:MogA/MoaB family molybdenum cofactor biosynthesis protein n=1 Tax=uncultured Desulfobacter sp. TaxID=240139 RepID=UPI002AAB3FB5|nr:molybdopterin-binding protein [uncultured Desulfobacter sp.]